MAYAPDIAIGDSIAHGLVTLKGQPVAGHYQTADNTPADTTIEKISPARVLGIIDDIAAHDPDKLKGRNVVLSSGISNNTVDLDTVRKELEVLGKAGAHVTLLGASTDPKRKDLAALNPELEKLVEDYNQHHPDNKVSFIHLTAITPKDHIHPENYDALLKHVVDVNSSHPLGYIEKTSPENTPVTPVSPVTPAKGSHLRYEDQDGLTNAADTGKVQELLRDLHFDLGKQYGVKHDGVDGKDGFRTHAALELEEKHLVKAGLVREEDLHDIRKVIAAMRTDLEHQHSGDQPAHPAGKPAGKGRSKP